MNRKARLIITALVTAAVITAGLFTILCGSSHESVTVSFVGDILLARGVEDAINDNSIEYIFESVKEKLSHADIAIGNLECALTESGVPAIKTSTLLFKASPAYAKTLQEAGFSLLNLANNHTMDFGGEGILSTIEAIEESGVHALGAGADKEDANLPVFIEKKGIKFGFLGFSDFPPDGYFTLSDKPDVAFVDRNTIAERIALAKKECDFLVVSFHWGREFEYECDGLQRELAHVAAESGADIIAGHHPHVLQGIEKYGQSYIFYSLGNFIFDALEPAGTDETVICDIEFGENGVKKIILTPVVISACRPEIVSGGRAETILENIKALSASLVAEIMIEEGVGYIEP